jgi:hypothetical protein
MASQRPVVTFDLDGVLCRPPFGINPGRLRKPGKRRRPNPIVRFVLDHSERWRYVFRRPMPGSLDGFRATRQFADCIVLTARGEVARTTTERWFARYLGEVPRIVMRPDLREPSPEFKRRRAAELGAAAHLEDDPNTAALIAETTPVLLVDWPRNAGMEGKNVTRVGGVAEAVKLLRTLLIEERP